MATKSRGIEGLRHGELDFEIQRGGKDVTQPVVNSLRAQAAPAQAAPPDATQELTPRCSARPRHQVDYTADVFDGG
jgi:hypothetical protein